jgi:predicted regulator of Ras-like GTPase activity (Roadblock/LC7/MglB family)
VLCYAFAVQELDELLASLVDNVDGALAALIGDADGLLIEQYPRQAQDLSAIAAQWTNVLTALKGVSQSLNGGEIKEVMVTADKLIGYARAFNKELFCFIVMNPSGNIGKARLYSQQVAKQLLEVLV